MHYTYLIGWSKTSNWYYGVRYSKHGHPDDLFRSYFTSSNYVKEFVKQYGKPDIIAVRRTFQNREAAILWEHKVLRRMKVIHDVKWLNKTDNKAIIGDPVKARAAAKINSLKGAAATRGKTWEEILGPDKATKRHRTHKQHMQKLWADGKISTQKPTDTINYKKAAEKRWQDPERKKQTSERMKKLWAVRKQKGIVNKKDTEGKFISKAATL